MNIYECGIMDKLVYLNTITDQARKSLTYGGQELGGYIKAVNDQGGPLSQGVIVRAGPMRVGPGGRVIGGAPP